MVSESFTQRIIAEYFEREGASQLQLDSYNHFLVHGLPSIIEEEPDITINVTKTIKYRVVFGDVVVDQPYLIEADRTTKQITPAAARLRDLSYDAPVCVNIREETYENDVLVEVKQHIKIPIARIPIMLNSIKCVLYGKSKDFRIKSGECARDPGGYFIIKGKERVLITQERANYNTVFVFRQKPQSKYDHIAEIRSMSEETGHSIMIQAKILPNGRSVSFSLPYITQEIPASIVIKAFGIVNNDEIRTIFDQGDVSDEILNDIIQEGCGINTQEQALEFIGRNAMHVISKEKRQTYAKQMLENELFPHLGTTISKLSKTLFLGYMVNKLVATHRGTRPEDDRDHVSTKRLETSGTLVYDIFRALYKRNNNLIKQYLQKRQDILSAITRSNQITNGLRHCFSTGNWGVSKQAYVRTGVSQVLARLTYGSTISHLRRLVIPIGKEGKNTKIRQLHSSQWGYICPSETPEGQSSGIVKNLANFTNITVRTPTLLLRSIIESLNSKYVVFVHQMTIETLDIKTTYKIMLNGIWLASTQHHDRVYSILVNKRTTGLIPESVSISINTADKELCVYGDEGRMVRPVYRLNKSGELITKESDGLGWYELIRKQQIRYIDTYEADNKMIATFPSDLKNPQFTYKFDYCEIHPSSILGTMAGMIPFPDHTQSPRNCYQAAMGKQALGIYAYSNELRTDTIVHQLVYPQKPLTRTHASKCLGFSDMVSGITAIVAVACYSGFNQEDSILLNRAAVDRGLFRSFAFKTIVAEEKKRSANSYENIGVPAANIRMKSNNYQKLDKNGIIYEGKKVFAGDVVVGKIITKTTKSSGEQYVDNSIVIKHGEEGVVDKVFISQTPDGYKLVKIKIRNQRIPEIGDKFASRHAQKGTCGMILRTEDMPFTEEGIVPDIIINPHAFPSRMTINYFLEALGSKSAVHKGIERDCTAFSESSTNVINHLYKELGDLGFTSNGYERMCSGYTGEQLNAKIFTGPVYYQRLKHLVGDKIHARDYGNVQSLTRQPLEGRSRDGGLRFGEMERDCELFSTPISLYSGRSIMIGKMVDCDWDVLSWSEKNQYIEKDQQTAFKHKGTRPCVELTLQDGRKITCTHNHPLLTNKGDWVMANDFDLTSDKLVVSKSGPMLDIDQEIKDCDGWHLEMPTIHLNTNNKKELLRSHAFVRIVGILITDGHITKEGYGSVFLGHKLDVESFLYDLALFSDSKPNPLKQKHCYVINLPIEIMFNINCLQGFVRGAKVYQEAVLPEFIKTAPKPIIREFLAAFFGGDGHTCVLGMHRDKRDILSSIGFSWSRKSEHIDSLVHVQNEIKNMLEMFGISGITIRTPKEISDSKQKSNADKDRNQSDKVYESNLHISINYLIKFYDNWLTNRVDELTGFSEIRIGPDKTSPINTKAKLKMPVCKAITQATDELRKKETIVHQYGIPTTKDISDHLQKGTEFGKFRGKGFPNASEFLTEIGVIDWFKNNKTDIQNYGVCCNDNGMSSMYMRVIDRRDVGEKEVCDITVKNNHNFLAEGVVSHNCMISHGVSGFLKERLFDMSDAFTINLCDKCGHIVTTEKECHVCQHDVIKPTSIPYACKLLFQELIAMGIKISLKPE
jgi:DNA-directed RNA polymerase II subunit RPB2